MIVLCGRAWLLRALARTVQKRLCAAGALSTSVLVGLIQMQ